MLGWRLTYTFLCDKKLKWNLAFVLFGEDSGQDTVDVATSRALGVEGFKFGKWNGIIDYLAAISGIESIPWNWETRLLFGKRCA